jgi:flagellar hook-associated protein 3 FlgL
MESAQQYQRNVAEAQGWTEVTESAMTTIVNSLHRARELTVQAASDSTGPESRLAIAKELEGLVDTLKTAANANYGGRYVFSGSMTDTRPYQMGAVDNYAGDALPVERQIGPGVTVQINLPGTGVIGNEAGGILRTLRTVIDHLDDPDPGASLSADLDSLETRLDEFNAVRATVGSTGNRLEVAAGRLAEYEGTTLQLLSETEDADMAKTMIDFTVQQNALQAGLKAGAGIVQLSLLDFLR